MLSGLHRVHRSAFIVSCCLLLTLFLAACGGSTSSSLTPTPTPKPSPSPSPSPTSSTTLTTYQGNGFTISYPRSWKVTASRDAVSFTDAATLNYFQIGITPDPGGVASSDTVVTAGVNAAKATLKNPQAVNIPPKTTIGGDSWVQKSLAGTTTSSGQNGVVQFVVAADNHPASSPSTKSFVIIYGTTQQLFATDNTMYYQPMLKSFKFAS